MSELEADSKRWFMEHVLPHESMLRGWLSNRFPIVSDDLDDIVQEAFTRICQARIKHPIDLPKAFLFATARNLALGRLRHNAVSSDQELAEMDTSSILDESADVQESVARGEELELLRQAILSLPPRCRQILTLRKIYGMPQKEIAAQLGVTEHTVEAQGVIALRKLADYFARHER